MPSADYGLTTPAIGTALPGNDQALTLTADGASVPVPEGRARSRGTFGYEASPAGRGERRHADLRARLAARCSASTRPPDGRQTMFQTFNQNQFMLQSELLRHGELAWLARSTYFGDQRNYLETHIDDNFLSDDSVEHAATHTRHRLHAGRCAARGARRRGTRPRTGRPSTTSGSTCCSTAAAASGEYGRATNGRRTDPLLTSGQFQAPTGNGGRTCVRLDQPHLGSPEHRPGLRARGLHRGRAQPEHELGRPGRQQSERGGLGLTASTDRPRRSARKTRRVVTGEHSGLANLIPGNPGPSTRPSSTSGHAPPTGGTLAAGSYDYAITDQLLAARRRVRQRS